LCFGGIVTVDTASGAERAALLLPFTSCQPSRVDVFYYRMMVPCKR